MRRPHISPFVYATGRAITVAIWLLLVIIPIALLTFIDFGGLSRDDYLGYLERRAAGAFAITTVFIYFFHRVCCAVDRGFVPGAAVRRRGLRGCSNCVLYLG